MVGLGMPLIRSRGAPVVAAALRPTRNGDPSYFFPATGSAVTVTAPTDASWSAWTELTAGIAADCVLATVNVDCIHGVGGAEARLLFLQLGIGAAGAEVAIGNWVDTNVSIVGNQKYSRQFRLDGYELAANTRLAARVRVASSCTYGHLMAVSVVAPPSPVLFSDGWDEDAYRQGGVDASQLVPDVPSFTNVACGAIDTWGNWVQFIASAANRLLVDGVNVSVSGSAPPPFPTRLALQIGIGAAGSEVAHEAVALASGTTAGPAGVFGLPRPVEALTGERVAVRTQTGKAAQGVSLSLCVQDLNF
jgi:hypothetical protein